jgi:hypothetical protein
MLTRSLPVLLLLACDAEVPSPAEDSEPPELDSDPPAVDSDPPAVDPDPEDPPVGPTRPASWGPGLVDLSSPWLGPGGLSVDGGDPVPPIRGPQEAPGLFAQLDDDPAIEVIVGASRLYATGETPTDVRVYDYDLTTRTLTRRPEEEDRYLSATMDVPYGAMDLDGDGHIDLLGEVGDAMLRWGRGDGTFEPGPPDGLPPDLELLNVEGSVFPMDIDGDGWLDLMAADANCVAGLMPFHRTGVRSYRWRPEWVVETTGSIQGASLVALPWPTGGDLFVVEGNNCDLADAHPGFYLRPPTPPGEWPVITATDLSPADASWKQIPTWFGLPWTAVAPMGVSANDYDHDGLFDVTLVLGTAYLTVLNTQPDGTFLDRTNQMMTPAGLVGPQYPYVEFAWSVAHPDLDLDGLQDLIITVGDDYGSFTQLHKDMAQMVFWSGGPWRFEEVTADVGLTVAGSFHGLYADDLDGDGDIDLVFGGYGKPPRLVRNDIEVGRRGLVVKLRGTTSNHLGVGAVVTASAPGIAARSALVGDAGNMVSRAPPLAAFGLGAADAADVVEVRWPSGLVQRLTDVPAGAVVIEEPPTLVVRPSPTPRHAPVDGVSEIELVATPRAADGSRLTGVAVTWSTFGRPVEQRAWTDADGDHLALRGLAIGTTVVEVAFDGVPVQVRPRLWWDAPE